MLNIEAADDIAVGKLEKTKQLRVSNVSSTLLEKALEDLGFKFYRTPDLHSLLILFKRLGGVLNFQHMNRGNFDAHLECNWARVPHSFSKAFLCSAIRFDRLSYIHLINLRISKSSSQLLFTGIQILNHMQSLSLHNLRLEDNMFLLLKEKLMKPIAMISLQVEDEIELNEAYALSRFLATGPASIVRLQVSNPITDVFHKIIRLGFAEYKLNKKPNMFMNVLAYHNSQSFNVGLPW